MRTFVAEFFYSSLLMREFIIADNQDISKAGMMFLLSKQKEVSLLLEADNKAELIQQLRLHPQAVIVLDYTLFNFAGADELIVLQERFKEADWILFSDELSLNFLRQVLFSSMAFGVVMKDNSKRNHDCHSMCHPQTTVYLQSCQQSVAFGRFFSAGCLKRRRSSIDTNGEEYPKRNCIGENDERDCNREKS